MPKDYHIRKTRIKYPKFDRPIVNIEGLSFEILDLSMSGFKFKGRPDVKLIRGDDYFVEIITMSHKPVHTKAKYARHVGDLFAMVFVKYIPEKLLYAEYTRLMKKFGQVEAK